MSIDRWMDKEAVVNIFNGILLSHKKGHIWLSSNKVKNTRAYYTSEASQKEKDKYHLLMQEDGTEEPICRATAETQTEQPCGYSGGGEGGMSWESSTETRTLPQVKQVASESCLYDAESSGQVLCDNAEAWDRLGGWRELQEGRDIHMSMADSCWCMAETHTIL